MVPPTGQGLDEGGVSTPTYLEVMGSSPEEVYPLDLLQTLPSDPAGDGVGEPPPLPTGLFSPFFDSFISKTSSFC